MKIRRQCRNNLHRLQPVVSLLQHHNCIGQLIGHIGILPVAAPNQMAGAALLRQEYLLQRRIGDNTILSYERL